MTRTTLIAAVALTLAACGTPERPREELVGVANQFYGAFNTGNKQQLLDLLAADFTDQMTSPRPDDGGSGALAYAVEGFKQGYPDLNIVIDQSWQDGDVLTVRTKVTGTNTGPLFGNPPTGKAVSFSTIDVFELEGSKIKNLWHIEQQFQMFQQLQ